MFDLSEAVTRKFTEVYDASDWEIETDSGWEPLIDIKQTIKYPIWVLTLDDNTVLECADTHIVFGENLNQLFVCDLMPGDLIQTKNGLVAVRSIINTTKLEHMYDLAVDSINHRYYSNNILSHNTTTAVGYLLWYAMFVDNSTILIAAHKYTGAQEIMQRLRYGYEMCPNHIKAGAVSYNKQSIEFENGSRIVAQTTTETTGRGMSVSLLYCLDGDTSIVRIRNKKTLIEEDITLKELFTIFGKNLKKKILRNTVFVENVDCEILTPTGWKDFRGVSKVGKKTTYRITLSSGEIVEATKAHYFFINNEKIKVEDLKIGQCIDTIDGPKEISKITPLTETDVYDIIEVDDENHQFIVNTCFITKNCDEFAYLEDRIAEEFWTSISPTLATGGKAIITSTPNSDEDQFAHIWKEANKKFDEYGNEQTLGRNGFFPYMAIWNVHPDRDEEWAKTEMARVTEERFRREHCCEFLVFDETLINSIKLSMLEGVEPLMKLGQVRWYKPVDPTAMYIIALDPSLGTGGDYSAIQVIEIPSLEQVGEWHHNTTPIQIQVKLMREICKFINDQCANEGLTSSIYYSVENNNVGEAALMAINEIGEETIPGLFLSEPIKKGHSRRYRKGFNTSHKSKVAICAKLKHLIENGKLKIKSKSLISELKTFVAQGVSFGAKSGENDDLVMSLLLALRMILLLQEWDPSIYEKLREVSDSDEFELPMPIFIVSS
jgi:hypothetical protein